MALIGQGTPKIRNELSSGAGSVLNGQKWVDLARDTSEGTLSDHYIRQQGRGRVARRMLDGLTVSNIT